MKTKNKASKRVISFLLVMAMICGCMGISGWGLNEAYADIPSDDASTYVTITDAETTYVTKQALDIGWFDIKPFMTSGAESYVQPDDILTVNALIEGVYFYLFGEDPDRADLQVAADSVTSQAIKAELNIYNGSWGLSTGSVFDNDKLVMSVINDSFGAMGIGGDMVSDGDDIIFYSYDRDYAYFEVLKITTGSVDYGTIYPVINVKLRVLEKTYPSYVAPIAGAEIDISGGDYCLGTASAGGVASVQLMRFGDPSEELLITAEADGVIKPYLRIAYNWDGSDVTITGISQAVLADTSLDSFAVNAYGVDLDASDYSSNDIAFDVDGSIENITLTAITADSGAVVSSVTASGITAKTVSFSHSTGGSVPVPLEPGLNTISFIVSNGADEEIYTVKINRSTTISDVIADVNRVIDGITSYTGYPASICDSSWIIGKIGTGKAISASEKEAFLTQTVNDVSGLNVGAKAKTAIALTALNIDATKVPSKNSDTIIDLVAQIYNYSGDTIPYITYLPYMLMLEDLGNYDIPDNAKWGRTELIQYAIDNYSGSSGWNAANGTDSAAMMIPALAPYYKNAENRNGYNGISQVSCAAIKVKVDEVIEQFKTAQEANGTFGNNANTTAVVIAALASLGLDADGSDFTKTASGKSVLEAIFTYETTDNRLGYTSTAYNELASKDGLLALASYLEYYASGSKNGDGSVYRFTKEITPYTSWPNADLLTGIRVTSPEKTVYSYDAGKTNDTVDTGGMTVTGVFNGDAANTSNVLIGDCTVSTINRATPGTQTVTVSYQGYTADFMITVENSDGTVPQKDTASVTVKNNNATIAVSNSMVIEEGETSALDVLKMLLDEKGISYVIKNGNYVSEIDGLGEFDKGANSGWLYSVNGTPPSTVSAKAYKLQDGDVVVWYYTLDYTKDSSTANWRAGKTEPETGASEKIAIITAASRIDRSGKAIASVSAKDVTSAINEALQGAGSGVRPVAQIIVEGADAASSVETTIPGSSMKELNSKTDGITIKTPIADISLDSDTINTLSGEAGGNIKITAVKLEAADIQNLSEEVKAEIGDRPVYDFSIMNGSRNIAEFDGKITITIPYTASHQEIGEGLVVYFLKDDGSLEVVRNCIYDSEAKTMTFTTRHFSKYALGYKALNFTDTVSHWAKNEIAYLAAREIVNGTTETTFSPNSNITRAQFVQILSNMAGSHADGRLIGAEAPFIDVPKTAWYSQAAVWAAEEGIVKGIENKDGSISFYPDTNISRQDMAVLLSRFAGKAEGYNVAAIKGAAVFLDEGEIAAYAAEAVMQLQQAGLINGKTLDTFAPADYATRAESAKMIAMLIRNSLQPLN
ncbi:MAG: S-layer homology domain-containing protein [Eubacteriales bacterium]|nr:S-layer homology domain-containing protein [Eubacteriales bacterium]